MNRKATRIFRKICPAVVFYGLNTLANINLGIKNIIHVFQATSTHQMWNNDIYHKFDKIISIK